MIQMAYWLEPSESNCQRCFEMWCLIWMSLRAMLYEHIILWWIYYFIITLIIVGTIGSLQQLHTFSQ